MTYVEKSAKQACKSNKEIAMLVYNRMLENRQKDTVKYRPFTTSDIMDVVHKPGLDFANLFDKFDDGDYAFITADYYGPFEYDLWYNVQFSEDVELSFNGEMQKFIPAEKEGLGKTEAKVRMKKGNNRGILKVTARDGKFMAIARLLVPRLHMGTDEYVYNTRPTRTIDGYRGMEGVCVSRLYKKDEKCPDFTLEAIDWIYPVKPEQSNVKTFDFNALMGKGYCAYTYTYFKGNMEVKHFSPMKIFADGKEIYCENSGETKLHFDASTELLFKSFKGENGWGFEAVSDGTHDLPFAEVDNCDDLKWIYIGPFGMKGENINSEYPLENGVDFRGSYASACAGTLYWKFYRKDTYLRQYLPTIFYGQWRYPQMVGHQGMRLLANRLNIKEFYDYFKESMSMLCHHHSFGVHEGTKLFGWSSYMSNGITLNNLDSIGTIGLNVCEYYFMTGDKKAESVMLELADAAMHNIPRFPDGTYHRVKTMWTDDMYMCLPFLARLGRATGHNKYFEEVVRQVKGFYERMFMHDQKIYSHIFFPQEGVANRIPWGRGNGWVLLAISEALMFMPEDFDGRDEVMRIFREFAQGVLNCRDKKEGIWHQVINNHESYIETSGSAMFITALARGITNGWIDKKYTKDVVEAWQAMADKCIDDKGDVYGVCMGSGCSKDENYYCQLQTIVNDDHGIGIVLGAAAEVLTLLDE